VREGGENLRDNYKQIKRRREGNSDARTKNIKDREGGDACDHNVSLTYRVPCSIYGE